MKIVDRVGKRYERLLVLERGPKGKDTNARWLCVCDCGKTVVAYGGDLQRGKVKSCGCLNAERIQSHGKSRTHVYNVWKQIFQRCENPDSPSFKNYGARGITVCDEWRDFSQFMEDMGDRPKGYTIEREDNNLGYCKENCKWATYKEQTNNSRQNRVIEFNGKSQTLGEWATELGMKWHTLRERFRLGWSVHDALTKPVNKRSS